MSTLHALIAADEIFEGEIKNAVLPNGTKVAIYNLNGAYYVTDDTCTHENASLSEEGMVEGSNVICGWHLCGFDIASGAATVSPCSEPLQTYPVTLVDGRIHVEL
jgi:p-cumate 2,3-dioxygenase ferredoxin component